MHRPPPRLTPRQREVARRVMAGDTYKTIGSALGICPQRVAQLLYAVAAKWPNPGDARMRAFWVLAWVETHEQNVATMDDARAA